MAIGPPCAVGKMGGCLGSRAVLIHSHASKGNKHNANKNWSNGFCKGKHPASTIGMSGRMLDFSGETENNAS